MTTSNTKAGVRNKMTVKMWAVLYGDSNTVRTIDVTRLFPVKRQAKEWKGLITGKIVRVEVREL